MFPTTESRAERWLAAIAEEVKARPEHKRERSLSSPLQVPHDDTSRRLTDLTLGWIDVIPSGSPRHPHAGNLHRLLVQRRRRGVSHIDASDSDVDRQLVSELRNIAAMFNLIADEAERQIAESQI